MVNPGEEEGGWRVCVRMESNVSTLGGQPGHQQNTGSRLQAERQGGPAGGLVLPSRDRASLVPWAGQRLLAQYTRPLHYPLGPLDNVNSSCC